MIKDDPAIFEFVSASDANKVIYARECLVGEWISSIHARMDRQGTNQAQIAERVGLSRAAISKVLRGPANVKVDSLIRIGLALGLTWDLQPTPADPAIRLPASADAGAELSTAVGTTGREDIARWLDHNTATVSGPSAEGGPRHPCDFADKFAA